MVDPSSYFLFQPVHFNWINKDHGMCCTIYGMVHINVTLLLIRARCSSVVRVFAHGAMGHRINPSWGGPIELFLVSASAPRLV